MTRLLADENFPLPVVEELRQRGHDVVTLYESGKAGQQVSDDEVLSVAIEEKRALLTLNRKHFIRLHTEKPNHTGIIVCTFDPDFEKQAQRIHIALENQPEMRGQLIRVNRPMRDTNESG
jgi:uncharacterized protein DUF5615